MNKVLFYFYYYYYYYYYYLFIYFYFLSFCLTLKTDVLFVISMKNCTEPFTPTWVFSSVALGELVIKTVSYREIISKPYEQKGY